MGEFGIFVIDNGGLDSPSCGSSIREELRCTTTVHDTELRNCFVDSTTNGQKAMILKNDSIIISKFLGDTFSFLRTEDDAVAPILSATFWLAECYL